MTYPMISELHQKESCTLGCSSNGLSHVAASKVVKRDFQGLRSVLMIHVPNASFGTATFLSDRPDRLKQFWRHKGS